MAKRQQAEFVQWMPFILEALREFGGSATPREVYDAVARLAKVPDEKRYAKLDSGSLRFPNQVAWGRQYLVWEELLTSPKRGLWMLTDSGRSTKLSQEQAREIFRKWVKKHAELREGRNEEEDEPPEQVPADVPIVQTGYREEVLDYLQGVVPAAFERFCADLLKQLGLERVEVTGGTGDHGIDGEGYLPVGPLVTTKIAFQCKRYAGPVAAKEIREFQGAIGSRAEKGLFFTTGYFTDSAKAASRMPGSIPVELIDGERLVDLLEKHEFGLREAKTFELDSLFLGNYPKQVQASKVDKVPVPAPTDGQV